VGEGAQQRCVIDVLANTMCTGLRDLVQGPPHAGSGCCLQVQVVQQLSWRLHHVLHAARPTQESALVLQLMKCTAARQACHQAAVGCRCKAVACSSSGRTREELTRRAHNRQRTLPLR
jgi:hypothetical protein